MPLPSLSIIVPSYNQAAYLEETLLSIIEQQYPGLQLIVIDGGSTDGSVDIIQRYAAHISYWVSEPDRGQSHAINKGLHQATGEWVAWMNSDDCYLPQRLVPFFAGIRPTAYDFIHGLCSSGPSMEHRYFRKLGRNTKKDAFAVLRFFMGSEFIIPSQSVFIRRSILEQVGFLHEELHYVMDMEWFTRILLQVPQSRVFFYDDALCFFRKHAATKTHSQNKAMQAEAYAVALQMASKLPYLQAVFLKRLVEKHGLWLQQFKEIQHIGHWLIVFWRFPLHARYSIAFWARLRQILRSGAGLPNKTLESYKVHQHE